MSGVLWEKCNKERGKLDLEIQDGNIVFALRAIRLDNSDWINLIPYNDHFQILVITEMKYWLPSNLQESCVHALILGYLRVGSVEFV